MSVLSSTGRLCVTKVIRKVTRCISMCPFFIVDKVGMGCDHPVFEYSPGRIISGEQNNIPVKCPLREHKKICVEYYLYL